MMELGLWIVAPIIGMITAYIFKNLVEKHILNHPECRKRILILTPYYMTLTFYLMLAVPLTKNYIHIGSDSTTYTVLYIVVMVGFPLISLVIFRFLLLRKARTVENVKLKRRTAKKNSVRDLHSTTSIIKSPSNAYLSYSMATSERRLTPKGS